MDIKKIEEICLSKHGAFIDYPFGPDIVVIKVKSSKSKARIFAQLFILKDKPKATFNCDATTGEFYRTMYSKSVSRGYHCPAVQQPYFITVDLESFNNDEEIIQMIEHSYSIVVATLPKYAQNELIS